MPRPHLLPIAAAALFCAAGPAFAQVFKPVDALIVNPPSRPVPVTGTVRLDNGGAVTGTLKSGDKNVTVIEQTIRVTSPTTGNHGTGQVDVSDYKEVRLSLSRGNCGGCSQVEVTVYGYTAGGKEYRIDEFVANQSNSDSFPWASRTYSVPGSKMSVGLRAVDPNTSNDVLVTLIGRAN